MSSRRNAPRPVDPTDWANKQKVFYVTIHENNDNALFVLYL